jgi:SAM-dependent methyltransferase
MERQAFDRMAELDSTHWWYVARRRILAALIEREVRLPADATILEIGCGTGHNLEMIGRYGALEAVELDDDARALASKRLGRPVRAGKLPDIADEIGRTFDLVTLLDVLEHIPDDREALAAIVRLMKPGGKLLLTVPANPWMWSAHDTVHHHHRRYRKREIAALAREAGLEIDLLSLFNSLLYPPIAAVRLLGQWRGKEESDDRMPPAPVNALLSTVFGMEAALVGRVPFPVGVSLVAILRRPVAVRNRTESRSS